MKQPYLIRQQWEAFADAVLPVEISELQHDEMQKAFFVGAAALFSTLLHVMSDDREPTEFDCEVMRCISDELAEYKESLVLK